MKKIILAIILLAAVALGCEKFDEGGYYYQSAKNIRGTWDYEQVVLNSETLGDSVFYARYRNSSIEFEEGSMVYFHWRDVDTITGEQTATYVFNYNKTKLNIVFDAYPLDDQVWEMEKLTKDELWYTWKPSDEELYHIKLKKKAK